MIVVAEVPSIEMDTTVERRPTGISLRSANSVIFQDCNQSTVSSIFLENINELVSSSKRQSICVIGLPSKASRT